MFSFVILNETLVTGRLGVLGLLVVLSLAVGPAGGGCCQREEGHGAEALHHPTKGANTLKIWCYLFCSLNFVQKCLQHLLTKITFNPQNTIISCTNVNEKHEWQVKASRLILRVTYVQIWTFGGNVSKHFEVEPCDRAVTLTSCPLQL